MFKPGMIILDETVTGSTEFCYEYATMGLPVIVVGEEQSEEIWRKALDEADAEFYLRKPVCHKVLVARVTAILRRYKRRGTYKR